MLLNFSGEILQHQDLNWTNIVTLIKIQPIRQLLTEAGYDLEITQKLVSGFTNGFNIGYQGPMNRRNFSRNLPFRVGSKLELWNKVMKEVQASRYAGPFNEPPSEHFVQSPLGLVPKAGNKTRLIFHLSHDFSEEERSINYYTPDEICTVKYNDLDHAVCNCLSLLEQANIDQEVLFFSKTDCSNAFRLIPVLVIQRILLTMMAEHPESGKKSYFIDKCLPFGSSRSCVIFQKFSDALAFIAKVKMVIDNIIDNPALTNYLDDFLFMALGLVICNLMSGAFAEVCDQIGCPISEEKMEKASPIMVFLSMLLNGKVHIISVPQDKVVKTRNMLNYTIHKRKITVKEVQQLMGTLNFLNRAIVPGRAFTRGMYSKLKLRDGKGRLLRQYHHVQLNKQFLQDCWVWLTFLQNVSRVQLC